VRVAVAMSGGVDSLGTALLLREQGHDVFGIHMRLLPLSGGDSPDAEAILRKREEALSSLASKLGISLAFVDMWEAFERCVIVPFIEAYQKGLTPNPCVLCNPQIKFGLLLEEARLRGADHLATGHYARILLPGKSSDRIGLCRARDPAKDQSYFLFGLSQEQLGSAVFPLGTFTKREVLQWAGDAGYAPLLPEESQEICFIPSGNYQEFLKKRLSPPPHALQGPILDMEGNLLGEHKGIFAYTVGQRRGLGISSTAPLYVVEIEPADNIVRVGRDHELFRSELEVEKVNWVSIPTPSKPVQAQVRIRNQHRPAPARVTPAGEAGAVVRFEEPQRAVTPGQAAVFYDGDLLLGGGTIMKQDRHISSTECL